MKWITPSLVLATLCILAPVPGHAEDPMLVNPDQMKWAPLPVIPGTEIAVLSGDPAKQGLFVMEWRGPAGSKAAPHWHSNSERVTLVSGAGSVGMGDAIDLQKGTPLTPVVTAKCQAKCITGSSRKLLS